MSPVRALVALVVGATLVAAHAPTAGGQTEPGLVADDLATADAIGYATPVGTLLRIPNELPGGALLSKSTLTLDKTQAIVAGYTPGELGEAFLQTTLVAPPELGLPAEVADAVAWKNPSLFTAQTPPSEVFPATAALAEGGVAVPPFEGGSLRAATTERSAAADAVGGLAISADGVTIGAGGSRSRTELLDDGTVVSEAHAFISDIRLADGLLRIGGIDSRARVSFRPGEEPEHDLSIEITGAQVLGVPVVIDRDGIRVAESTLLGLGQLQTVDQLLASLADQGFSVTLFPGVVEEVDEQSVRVAGAALSIRGDLTDYVPTNVDTPLGPVGSPLGDVGTDNEILLGQVEASAFAAERGPLPDFGPPIPPPPAPTPTPTPAPVATGTATSASSPAAPDRGPSEVAAPATGGGDFELIRRDEAPGVEALRIGYRWVLVCALAGTFAHLLRRRSRLT